MRPSYKWLPQSGGIEVSATKTIKAQIFHALFLSVAQTCELFLPEE
jgi:hypothetical protein